MKKGLALIISSLCILNANATSIPYCDGTETPSPSKNAALQYVVNTFANKFHCVVEETGCLLNYATVKYAIGWQDECMHVTNSTFICENGWCKPLGFAFPTAPYYDPKS
ncbi:MAG TPA: hypothetical protein VHM20_05155 [Gammaproteobacteria bacterium]|nr:hypothetical protein [Gammaproteobacteria bacterium]